jgi:hypothetical protein
MNLWNQFRHLKQASTRRFKLYFEVFELYDFIRFKVMLDFD